MNTSQNQRHMETEKKLRDAMLFYMEQEFQRGLFQSVQGDHAILSRLSSDPAALEPLIAYISKNPHFYRIYLSRSTEVPFDDPFRIYWQGQVKPLFQSYGVQEETHMRYYYEYFKAGLLTVLRLWLEGGCAETTKELSQMISRMLPDKPDGMAE